MENQAPRLMALRVSLGFGCEPGLMLVGWKTRLEGLHRHRFSPGYALS